VSPVTSSAVITAASASSAPSPAAATVALSTAMSSASVADRNERHRHRDHPGPGKMAVPHGEMAGKSWEKVEHEENLLEQLMEKTCTTWKTPWKHVEDTWKVVGETWNNMKLVIACYCPES
jgi:hypothetical protein